MASVSIRHALKSFGKRANSLSCLHRQSRGDSLVTACAHGGEFANWERTFTLDGEEVRLVGASKGSNRGMKTSQSQFRLPEVSAPGPRSHCRNDRLLPSVSHRSKASDPQASHVLQPPLPSSSRSERVVSSSTHYRRRPSEWRADAIPTFSTTTSTIQLDERHGCAVDIDCGRPGSTPVRSARDLSSSSRCRQPQSSPPATHLPNTADTSEHDLRLSHPGQRPKNIRISVLAALTGEHVAELDLSENKTVAMLKLQIAQIMDSPASDLSLLSHDFSPLMEFSTIGSTSEGTDVVVHVVVDEQFCLPGTCRSYALPFEGLEREYLPASGLVDSALGESVLRARQRTLSFVA